MLFWKIEMKEIQKLFRNTESKKQKKVQDIYAYFG